MSWNFIDLENISPTPLPHGGGTSRELIAWPVAADWDWRLSVDEITGSSAFSPMDGVQCWLAVLLGAGVQFELEGQQHLLTPLAEPFRFEGTRRASFQLQAGPAECFNLMARGGRAQAEVWRVGETRASRLPPGTKLALFTSEQRAKVEVGSEIVDIPPYTLAWRAFAEPVLVQAWGETLLWAQISKGG